MEKIAVIKKKAGCLACGQPRITLRRSPAWVNPRESLLHLPLPGLRQEQQLHVVVQSKQVRVGLAVHDVAQGDLHLLGRTPPLVGVIHREEHPGSKVIFLAGLRRQQREPRHAHVLEDAHTVHAHHTSPSGCRAARCGSTRRDVGLALRVAAIVKWRHTERVGPSLHHHHFSPPLGLSAFLLTLLRASSCPAVSDAFDTNCCV